MDIRKFNQINHTGGVQITSEIGIIKLGRPGMTRAIDEGLLEGVNDIDALTFRVLMTCPDRDEKKVRAYIKQHIASRERSHGLVASVLATD